jgi:glycosyltransferase involved in cell wall biosynthesis
MHYPEGDQLMHIFFITQWYPTPEHPTYGVFILEHARAVAKILRVSLLHIQGVDQTLQKSIQITNEQVHQNFIIYHLSYRRPALPHTSWLRKFAGARKGFNFATQCFGCPDVIHANVSNTAGPAVFLGRMANIPVVMSEYSSEYGRKLFKRWRIPVMRYLMNRVNLIMPDSDDLAQHIRAYGIHRPMIKVHNVVDAELFYPAAAGEQVTSPYREVTIIARLDKEKAVGLAIQAVGRLQSQGIYFLLHIVGDGKERSPLDALVSDLHLSDWIIFHGFQPKVELARLLRRSSVFLLSSLWESKPVVILEALTCGLPIVAPAIGGIPEVITASCGMLFTPGDLNDLVDKLGAMLSRLEDYNARSIRSYAIDTFSQAAVGNQLNSIYQKIKVDKHTFDDRHSTNTSTPTKF